MATIKDIANQANVSTTTVSRVINDHPAVNNETRKKILKIIKKNNYRPNTVARSLSTSKSNTIGVFFTDNFNSGLHHPFFREVIYGLEKFMGDKGYDIVYFTNRQWGDSFSYLDKCQDRHVDGVVLMGVLKDDPNLPKLLASDIPVVFVDIDIKEKNASYVISDNISGAKKAVKYLYELGHRKIGMLMGIKTAKPTNDRFIGFKEALKELDLKYTSNWVFNGKYSEEGGYRAAEKMLNLSDRPTAVFCQSDNMAIGAMRAIEDAGFKVPDDFSVIGFDDIEVSSYVKPALTTIKQNKKKMGQSATQLLVSMIEKSKNNISPIILPVELIERDSCKYIE